MRVPQVCLDSLLAKCVSGCSSPMTELINRPYNLTARFAAYRQPFGIVWRVNSVKLLLLNGTMPLSSTVEWRIGCLQSTLTIQRAFAIIASGYDYGGS